MEKKKPTVIFVYCTFMKGVIVKNAHVVSQSYQYEPSTSFGI